MSNPHPDQGKLFRFPSDDTSDKSYLITPLFIDDNEQLHFRRSDGVAGFCGIQYFAANAREVFKPRLVVDNTGPK